MGQSSPYRHKLTNDRSRTYSRRCVLTCKALSSPNPPTLLVVCLKPRGVARARGNCAKAIAQRAVRKLLTTTVIEATQMQSPLGAYLVPGGGELSGVEHSAARKCLK